MSEYRRTFRGMRAGHQTCSSFEVADYRRIGSILWPVFENLQSLTPEDITSMDSSENELLSKALRYFREKDETLQSLVHALQLGFAEDKSIIMNGKTDNTREKQLAVNSLEDPSNPYRIIFTVDMLNEGWDVLNLFDIVRLYETRQSGRGKISSYTIKEAQLIGRGASILPVCCRAGSREV